MADVTTEKKDLKSKLVTAAVIVVLCLIFVVGFIYGLNSVLAMEGAFPPVELTAGKTVLPDTAKSSEAEIAAFTKDDMVRYLNGLLDTALTNEAKLSNGRDYRIDTDSLTCSGGDKMLDTLKYIADDAEDGDTQLGKALRGDFESASADFGEDVKDILRLPVLTAEDIESFDISYIYYVCPTCGDTSDEKMDSCEDCGSPYPYNEQYRDDYSVTLTLANNETVLKNNFSPRTDEEIKALLKDGADGNFTLTRLDRVCTGLTIRFTVNRADDHIKNLSYEKNFDVDMTAAFEGSWEALGTTELSFGFTQTDSFALTWPAIELDEHKMYIEPKGTDNLIATLTCAEPTKMTVIWYSSDPDTVSVDDEGYMKACKEDGGKAVITAEYEFNGKKYSDSCEVTVKYPVESTAMKKNKVKLAPGEEYPLEVKFDPKKATVQTLTWYTEDADIATVDENGVVTAVAKGETTVYSLSDDGYFRSSCKVTVE